MQWSYFKITLFTIGIYPSCFSMYCWSSCSPGPFPSVLPHSSFVFSYFQKGSMSQTRSVVRVVCFTLNTTSTCHYNLFVMKYKQINARSWKCMYLLHSQLASFCYLWYMLYSPCVQVCSCLQWCGISLHTLFVRCSAAFTLNLYLHIVCGRIFN